MTVLDEGRFEMSPKSCDPAELSCSNGRSHCACRRAYNIATGITRSGSRQWTQLFSRALRELIAYNLPKERLDLVLI